MGMSDLFGGGDSGVVGSVQGEQGLYKNINTPNINWRTYDPTAYNAQNATAQTVSNDPLIQSAQMAALNKMGDLSNTGLSAVDAQGYQQAANLGNQLANSGSQAAIQNAQARGLAGSGMEFANREIANQQGAQRAQEAGLQQAADAARQRALYNQAYSGAAGQMQQQQTGLNAQNAGILNQFNMANTQAQNQGNMYNVGNQNQAQLINTQGQNQAAQQNYEDQMQKAGAQVTADQNLAGAYGAQNAADQSQTNAMLGLGTSLAGAYMTGGASLAAQAAAKQKAQQGV